MPSSTHRPQRGPDNQGVLSRQENAFKTVTKKSIRFAILESTPPTPIPPELVPDFTDWAGGNIDISRPPVADLVARDGIPEILPVFLAMRHRLAQHRTDSLQAALEAEAKRQPVHHQLVAQYVGKSIIQGKVYSGPQSAYRPSTLRERVTAGLLERLASGRIRRNLETAKIAELYADPGNPQPKPDFASSIIRPSHPEKRAMGVQHRRYNKLNGQAQRRDKAFGILAGAGWAKHKRARIEKLKRKRDKLMLKSEALRQAMGDKSRNYQ